MSRDDSLGELVSSRSTTNSASPGTTEFSLSSFLQGLTRSLVLGRSTGGWVNSTCFFSLLRGAWATAWTIFKMLEYLESYQRSKGVNI